MYLAAPGLSWVMWVRVPWPGIEFGLPELGAGVLGTEPPGKPDNIILTFIPFINYLCTIYLGI